ncbi:DUF305 domain-containing protein [Deinococcus maricopensis]|uniref:DUF305 domain-containing protein n=1 Tax=Deinococcus maricopensis (strain DSM 21211 / LMG 22137 / NRRL B-23946 / LB-34) TaxID=709986 RepID=E8U5W8_DEIML|nr:DUF305 domain-containing protein [Deinococcus maricopensis]ADV66457.1 protein of unknown function DUF305 [Deinococcus maricopensis DSM 21211]
MSRRVPLVPTLLVVCALIAAAFLFARRAPGEGSTDVRFIREMTQHHLQAIDMAVRLRDRTQDRDLRAITLDIMLSQQDQVGQMRGWLTLWGRPWAGQGMTAEHARAMGMASAADLRSLDTLPVRDAETQFLKLMIRHHQGALSMVQPVLNGGVQPAVQALAQQINATQTGEINLMKSLLARRGEQAPTPSMPDMPGMSDHHH